MNLPLSWIIFEKEHVFLFSSFFFSSCHLIFIRSANIFDAVQKAVRQIFVKLESSRWRIINDCNGWRVLKIIIQVTVLPHKTRRCEKSFPFSLERHSKKRREHFSMRHQMSSIIHGRVPHFITSSVKAIIIKEMFPTTPITSM